MLSTIARHLFCQQWLLWRILGEWAQKPRGGWRAAGWIGTVDGQILNDFQAAGNSVQCRLYKLLAGGTLDGLMVTGLAGAEAQGGGPLLRSLALISAKYSSGLFDRPPL